MKYNTELSKLIIPEYGRHIHQIIENLCLIKDKKKRNQQAEVVIQIMGNLNPHLRDVNDFKHKLWDHLFIMSDFKLDVDSPYPIPKKTWQLLIQLPPSKFLLNCISYLIFLVRFFMNIISYL